MAIQFPKVTKTGDFIFQKDSELRFGTVDGIDYVANRYAILRRTGRVFIKEKIGNVLIEPKEDPRKGIEFFLTKMKETYSENKIELYPLTSFKIRVDKNNYYLLTKKDNNSDLLDVDKDAVTLLYESFFGEYKYFLSNSDDKAKIVIEDGDGNIIGVQVCIINIELNDLLKSTPLYK